MSEPTSNAAAVAPMHLAYRPHEFAPLIGVSVAMLHKHLAMGTFPARKLGDAILILADDAREALQKLPRAVYTKAGNP